MYAEHYPSVYRYVYRRMPGRAGEVQDVVADVFAVAWRRLDDVPPAPEDRLWLYGAAWRYVSRARRSGLRRLRLHARLFDEARGGPASNGLVEDTTALLVRDAIQGLRPADREVLQLVMWDELSHAEAAKVLGCSPNAVAVRMHRARERLRSALGSQEDQRQHSDQELVDD